MRGLCLTTLFVASLMTAGSAAQGFELDVISVRESGGGLPQPSAFQPGRMVLANWDLQGLVRFAFGLQDSRIEGWPQPDLPKRRFTLTATYSGASTPPLAVQQRLVREILEDRFGMRTHIDQREQAVYMLRLVKPGALGPGIRQVEYDCTDPETRARRGAEDCPRGDRSEERGMVYRGSGPIAVLVNRLQFDLQERVVVDRTGLNGFYQWELLRSERGVRPPPLPELLPVQLGMTIETTRAPVDIVVIDAISMPTAN